MQISKPWKLLAAVMAFVMLAAISVVALTHDLIFQLSKGADEAEHGRNIELVQAALNGLKSQLEKVAIDNAAWDDAVRHSYGNADTDWVQETWGVTTSMEVHAFDRIMVVDGVTGGALVDVRRGIVQSKPIDSELKASIAQLISLLPNDTSSSATVSGFSHSRFGHVIVAASPIVPTSDDLAIAQVKPNYLVLIRDFNDSLIDEMIGQIKLDSLKMATFAKGQLSIYSNEGAPLLALDWRDANSGTLVGASIETRANLTLAFMLLAMTGAGLCCWYYLNRMLHNEARARHDSLHDPLTGLPNRSALAAELRKLYAKPGRDFAIAFADLDGFKDVNDSFGHLLGDRLLCTIADGLRDRAKQAHLLCRMGGDEFVVLFSGPAALDMCNAFASEMIAYVAKPFDFDGRIASVGASIGIATPVSAAGGSEELLRCADIAMYRSKSLGKNQCCIYDQAFDADRQFNKDIGTELLAILRNRSLDVVYQPVVDARTSAIVSVEALARWPKSSPRQLTPDKFIRTAELSGLIDELGELVLEKSCLAAKAWDGMSVSVNISPLQLNNPDFLERVTAIIARTGIAPSRIELEITENVLIDNFERARKVLESLRRLGVKLALDDFGSGYSSIGYLRQFRFDRVKIDRSISSRITMGQMEQSIVHGIMLVARGLSATVTAEGVEKEEEVALLKLAGCMTFQGYYFHRPQSAEDIAGLLRQGEDDQKTARIA